MYNILAYTMYLLMTSFITIYVGYCCHKSGGMYLQYLLGDHAPCQAINNLLLCGYYLVNIGYAAWSLQDGFQIGNVTELLTTLSVRTGSIVCLLCVLHYINILTFYLLSRKYIHS